MKKALTIALALIFGIAPASFAATTLTDKQLDDVNAGDWVVLQPGESVADVYYSNNTLDLKDTSQKELQAVSNANAVDSAIAVQTNIASVTGMEPSENMAINGTNIATVTNYNPSESWDMSSKTEETKWLSEGTTTMHNHDKTFNLSKTESTSHSLVETLDEVTTLDITYAAASHSEKDCKSCEEESTSAEAFLLDYDKIVDYDKNETSGSFHNKKIAYENHEATTTITSHEEHHVSSSEDSSSYRKNLSENNHLNLKDNSQQLLQAVSNLNAVGSAAAIQTNIASNVGSTGTITHSNLATVVNGL